MKEVINWIATAEKLPEPFQSYLFYREDAGVFVGYYGSLEDMISNDEYLELAISEERYFALDWYSYESYGIQLLEYDLIPTYYAELPKFDKRIY